MAATNQRSPWQRIKNYAVGLVKKPTSAPHVVRTFGDPVLKTVCSELTTIDDSIRQLAQDMLTTMYLAPGVGLAANQVGMQKRLFVYDAGEGDGPQTMINPEIIESSGEFFYEEGCLSVPGLYFNIGRPDTVVVRGLNLEGEQVEFTASGFHGRILQHEIDHLNGKLLLSRLTPDQRKVAMKSLRDQAIKSS